VNPLSLMAIENLEDCLLGVGAGFTQTAHELSDNRREGSSTVRIFNSLLHNLVETDQLDRAGYLSVFTHLPPTRYFLKLFSIASKIMYTRWADRS